MSAKFVTWTSSLIEIASFVGLVILYGLVVIAGIVAKYIPAMGRVQNKLHESIKRLDRKQQGSISRIELIELSLANMRAKRTRTMVTVGGMTIGIASIVFLVSIGYGLQALVISRVARLDEMKQIDVTVHAGSKLRLNDESHATFRGIPDVEQALPLIAVVGKVKYSNSATDMAVYGVTHDYLEQSAIKPVVGRIFDNNEVVVSDVAQPIFHEEFVTNKDTTDAGGADIPISEDVQIGSTVRSIKFSVDSGQWVRVRAQANSNADLLGYISSETGQLSGEEIWGETYVDEAGRGTVGTMEDGRKAGLWIKVRTPVWEEKDGQYVPMMDSNDNQVVQTGYVAEINVSVEPVTSQQVLGDAIDITNDDWVEVEGESIPEATENTEVVQLPKSGEREAVVNRGFLEILSISEDEVLGKTFEVTFVATGGLLNDDQKRLQSESVQYTIIGVTPDNRTPLFYVPFTDLREMGLENFSQIKIVAKNQDVLPAIRRQIEGLGFNTHSVVDTVDQINSLFASARMLLALLGLVALSVAALGMFNTLTVSLLERTREVGLLKSMGMKSYEVRDLFLAESMVMGSLGGVLGLLFGLGAGKILELILSAYALSKGAGFITIVDIPITFTLVIILLSFMVGIITGFYPARRATQISALNALRYE